MFDKYAALAYEVVEKSLRTRLGDGVDVLRLSRHVASLVRASGLAAGDYLSPTPADVAFASNANFTDRQRDEVNIGQLNKTNHFMEKANFQFQNKKTFKVQKLPLKKFAINPL